MTTKNPELRLGGCRVLVVEDEFFIADDLAQLLERNGAKVIGPAPTVDAAIGLVKSDQPDCAVVDVNLRGQMAYALADELRSQNVPFVFATGYDPTVIPSGYADVPRLQKPYDLNELLQALPMLVQKARGGR